jgi:hypothetical protein
MTNFGTDDNQVQDDGKQYLGRKQQPRPALDSGLCLPTESAAETTRLLGRTQWSATDRDKPRQMQASLSPHATWTVRLAVLQKPPALALASVLVDLRKVLYRIWASLRQLKMKGAAPFFSPPGRWRAFASPPPSHLAWEAGPDRAGRRGAKAPSAGGHCFRRARLGTRTNRSRRTPMACASSSVHAPKRPRIRSKARCECEGFALPLQHELAVRPGSRFFRKIVVDF